MYPKEEPWLVVKAMDLQLLLFYPCWHPYGLVASGSAWYLWKPHFAHRHVRDECMTFKVLLSLLVSHCCCELVFIFVTDAWGKFVESVKRRKKHQVQRKKKSALSPEVSGNALFNICHYFLLICVEYDKKVLSCNHFYCNI